MILSRALARRRMAAGVRPSWLAAWGPVAIDAASLLALVALLFAPARALIAAYDPPLWAMVLALFFLVYLPSQFVLILSSLWAAKSRYLDPEGNQS
ncbi:hypothetical protein [Thalassorhabdomicrobium marinisediminis]|uniref:Uncharacterized protein n=1 Tax=Thalassorhabdomicrobium marinisediminis TaxID=2170577 RepID=A0A2T7FVR2_9RHOB|nr:hypothetical protein [Thalassorhabdomicrobium marinisediminis]PVA06251.1 hypothetical protein DC363_10075 [Thalassorhabdomicrobium marinisediminis]